MFRAARCRKNGNTMAVATSLGTEQVTPGVGMSAGDLQPPTFGDRIIDGCANMLVLVTLHPISILTRRGGRGNRGLVFRMHQTPLSGVQMGQNSFHLT